jgi:hypothetical protein
MERAESCLATERQPRAIALTNSKSKKNAVPAGYNSELAHFHPSRSISCPCLYLWQGQRELAQLSKGFALDGAQSINDSIRSIEVA